MNVGFAYALGAAVTWGVVYAIDQKILSSASPATLIFIDAIITALVVLPLLFVTHGPLKLSFPHGEFNWFIIVLSLALAVLANYFIYSGIKLVGASSASIIEIAYPFFVVLFSYIFFRAAPNIAFLIGGFLIFAGSAIITYFH